ncbi:MAG TPA: adenosylcobinamide-phosphate synthase CbiB [Bacteroidales bacterium]
MMHTNPYLFTIPLIVGFLLDLVLGDPLWLPHPVRLFGSVISYFEEKLNHDKFRIVKGGCIAIFFILFTWFVFYLSFQLVQPYPALYYTVATLFVFYGLANHSLVSEALKVNRKLNEEGLEAGRKQLSFIVGRDTANLSANQIRIAILETLSENLSDGVIAPLFYYAIGSFPLMMAYKMINTLDSMIGYKSERFKDFGMIAARTDDIANFIPARITAFLMVLATFNLRGLIYIFKYGHKHSSPNSGYPEAALAGILNCRFGGPNVYHGKPVEKPFIGKTDRVITDKNISGACLINLAVSFLCIILIIFSSFYIH